MEDNTEGKLVSVLTDTIKKRKRKKFEFKKYYIELLKYRKQNGNVNVPVKYVAIDPNSNEEYKLGYYTWAIRVNKNRLDKGKKTEGYVLTEKQYQMLNLLEFRWKKERKFNFETFYDALLSYRELHGNLNVPVYFKTHSPTGGSEYPLGYIVSQVRKNKNKLDNGEDVDEKFTLTDKQYVMLYIIGFDFKSFIKEKLV